MDNISHSVVGLAAGELLHRSLKQESDNHQQQTRRRLLLVSCWAASNFPDLDLFLTRLLPNPLGYLLHHRGHTHTLLYAIPQAILLALIIWLCWPSARKLLQQSTRARIGFAISLGLGFLFHLSMDYLNSYGVHPFHPFNSGWLYGDMVFIVEPVFWIMFGVPLIMMLQNPKLKILLMSLLIGVPVFFTFKGFLLWQSIAVLLLLAIFTAMLQQQADKTNNQGKKALIAAFAISLGFIGIQDLASKYGKALVSHDLSQRYPTNRLLDIAMSPFPTNPLCWNFISVESKEKAGTYQLREGIVSLAPIILPIAACPTSLAKLPPQVTTKSDIAFLADYQGDLDRLRTLSNQRCDFKAWLRFARVPLLKEDDAVDLRFGSMPTGNFTTLALNKTDSTEQPCSRFIPQWDFPRSDLITPASSASK